MLGRGRTREPIWHSRLQEGGSLESQRYNLNFYKKVVALKKETLGDVLFNLEKKGEEILSGFFTYRAGEGR